ncbi:MAG: gluconate 2-dehydrogenase subunit 3 family protein [Oceanicaulis sp.]
MRLNRRNFLKQSAVGALAFKVGGAVVTASPAHAYAEDFPMQVLSAEERAALEAFGDTILPGAAQEGLAHFIDSQLAAESADSLLIIRYLDVPPPYAGFYKAALAALDAAAGGRFADLSSADRLALARRMGAGEVAPWRGPPAAFVLFVLRMDAIDVVYGTEAGFDRLDLPYMAHIAPPARW